MMLNEYQLKQIVPNKLCPKRKYILPVHVFTYASVCVCVCIHTHTYTHSFAVVTCLL